MLSRRSALLAAFLSPFATRAAAITVGADVQRDRIVLSPKRTFTGPSFEECYRNIMDVAYRIEARSRERKITLYKTAACAKPELFHDEIRWCFAHANPYPAECLPAVVGDEAIGQSLVGGAQEGLASICFKASTNRRNAIAEKAYGLLSSVCSATLAKSLTSSSRSAPSADSSPSIALRSSSSIGVSTGSQPSDGDTGRAGVQPSAQLSSGES